MKIIKLKNKNINVRTEISELTYSEVIAFQQYFAKITYDIETNDIDNIFAEIKKLFDRNQYADMWILFYNWYIGIKTQQKGGNAWIYCFGLLLEKPKLTIEEVELIELVREQEKDGLTMEQIIEGVEGFGQAFPLLFQAYMLRAEGLIQLMLQKSSEK